MQSIVIVFLALAAVAFADGPKEYLIVKYVNDALPDGSSEYSYETSNGIVHQEKGFMKDPEHREVQGSYEFKTPEGAVIQTAYIANDQGFQATGNAIPTPHPHPAWLTRALQWIADHPYKEEDHSRKH